MSTVLTGTVARWFSDRGFGFINPGDGRDDIFAHISECDPDLDELKSGQRVAFQISANNKRPGTVMAVNINIISKD